MTRLSDIMRATPAHPTVRLQQDRASGEWIRATGQPVAMRDMNPWHRENAIRKARASGQDDLAAELETHRPEGHP